LREKQKRSRFHAKAEVTIPLGPGIVCWLGRSAGREILARPQRTAFFTSAPIPNVAWV
jgi:hypothetical protein